MLEIEICLLEKWEFLHHVYQYFKNNIGVIDEINQERRL